MGDQVIGGTGGGACPTCGQYSNACRCVEAGEELVRKMRADIAESEGKAPCARCGRAWLSHPEVVGVGRVCPVAAFTYQAPGEVVSRTSEG